MNFIKDMKSIILKIFEKIRNDKVIKLFKSHNPNLKHGEQVRDFIYVKDVINVINWFLKNQKLMVYLMLEVQYLKVLIILQNAYTEIVIRNKKLNILIHQKNQKTISIFYKSIFE